MLDEQEGNFARCLQLQLSELRWKRVARICPTAGVSTDAVCRSPQTVSGVRYKLETSQLFRRLQHRELALIKTLASAEASVFWAKFASRALFFDENLD